VNRDEKVAGHDDTAVDVLKLFVEGGLSSIGVPRNFFSGGGGSTNPVEDRGHRERGLGAAAP
jgi:hypothetical protein